MNHVVHNISPRYWGPGIWKFIYSFIAVYPEKGNCNSIDNAFKFFHSLIHLLPCSGCRESYSVFMKEPDTDIDDSSNFISRDRIILFAFNLRKKVNKKVDNDYFINLNYFKKKLDVMFCDKTNKLSGYTNLLCEVSFVQDHMTDKVLEYLKNKTSYNPEKTSVIINKSKKFLTNPNFDAQDKEFIFFFYRNIKCRNIHSEIYNTMQVEKISKEDSYIQFKELYDKLLFWGCTFLTSEQLESFISL